MNSEPKLLIVTYTRTDLPGDLNVELAPFRIPAPLDAEALLGDNSLGKVTLMDEITFFYTQEAKLLVGFLLKQAADIVQDCFEKVIP